MSVYEITLVDPTDPGRPAERVLRITSVAEMVFLSIDTYNEGNPTDRSRVDAAIRKVARQGEVFSANDVRPLIEGVPGPLVGARFNAAAKAGVIVRVGYEPSTQARTHAHPIAQWRAA